MHGMNSVTLTTPAIVPRGITMATHGCHKLQTQLLQLHNSSIARAIFPLLLYLCTFQSISGVK